jgi:hypothetical protein
MLVSIGHSAKPSGWEYGPQCHSLPGEWQLFTNLSHFSIEPGEAFYLDTPEVNPNAIQLVETYRMEMGFETARMYTQEAPDLPIQNIYGITSFELGWLFH